MDLMCTLRHVCAHTSTKKMKIQPGLIMGAYNLSTCKEEVREDQKLKVRVVLQKLSQK